MKLPARTAAHFPASEDEPPAQDDATLAPRETSGLAMIRSVETDAPTTIDHVAARLES